MSPVADTVTLHSLGPDSSTEQQSTVKAPPEPQHVMQASLVECEPENRSATTTTTRAVSPTCLENHSIQQSLELSAGIL